MNPVKWSGIVTGIWLAVTAAGARAQTVVPLDPKAAYLHVCNDAALAAPALSLAGLGIVPGQSILIEVLGDWDCGSPCTDNVTGTIGVFSASATLLAGSQAHRVPDAIAAGSPVTTPNTYWCSTATDIPEDFLVEPAVTVVVPQGATHLFISARDVLYDDNLDPDADYAVRITGLALAVESTTWGKVKSLYAVR